MRALVAVAGLVLVVVAGPASAADPVADDATKQEVVDALAEARQVQGVCYGWELQVADEADGLWGGVYLLSDSGLDRRPDEDCPRSVVLNAGIRYTSDTSEAEDSASWTVVSTGLLGPATSDLERLGLDAGQLLDDDRAELAFVNAVLALPGLTAERDADVEPLVLDEEPAAAPPDARATDTPGSDRLREHRWTAVLLLTAVAACLFWAACAWWPRLRRRLKAALDEMSD